MKTRIATALAAGDAVHAAHGVMAQIHDQLGAEAPVLVLLFASTKQPLTTVAPLVAARWPRATVLGASTAGEFTERGDAKGSVSAFALAGDFRVFARLACGLGADVEGTVQRAVEPLPSVCAGYEHRTAIVLVDPLAGNAEEATLIAATLLGDAVRLAGGAAGDDLAMHSTQVSCGVEVASDAIVVAEIFSREPVGVGVAHGHEALSGPLEVTRAAGNVVHEIDGRPAWEVWKRETARSAALRGVDPEALAPADVTPYLLRYEAGLATGSGYKIRAPLARNADGSLSFACGIPQGAVLRITESVPERQVESARRAAAMARAQLGRADAGANANFDVAGALVFDCICRNLILGADFRRGVSAVSEELGHVPLAGFETYGEIAFDAGDMSGFHNTTTVVMAFAGSRS